MKSLTFPARKSLLLLLILCSPLHGADLDWEADTGDARWDEQAAPAGGDVNTNWENDVLPAATDSVTFDASGQNELTVDLNGDRTVLSLTFNYSQSYTLEDSTLTLDDGDITVSDGDHIINSNVILSDDTSEWALFDIGTNDSLTINGIWSGGNFFVKDTAATEIYTGANTITSGVTISSGRLILKDGDDRLPTDTQLTIGVGAELEIDGISQTIGQLVPQDGSINLINNGVFRVGNGNESGGFAGTITGNGSLVKLGNALLELNGASTYSGDTTINAGTLRVGNSTGSATGTGLVTVTNNAALDGTGSVGGAVTVDSGGTIAPGTSVGTLSVGGDLTLNGDFVCEIDGATADQLAVAGTLDVTGGDLEISILNPPTSGSYVIATAGTVTGPFANVTGLPDSYVLSYSAGAVTIEIPDLLYVDENAAPGGDGLSWATAFDDLQDALTLPLTDTDIWVAQGTYLPDTGTDRSAAFQLLDGVEVLGGFPTPDGGTPDPGLGDRDPDAYPTILSGDLDGNDGSGAPTGNNAYHVVTSSGTDATAILDGFTITNGLADGVDADSDGAGLFNVSGSPIVRNCLFTNCVADRAGGGVFNEETDAAPVFEDCTFLSNVGVLGGAMRNRAGCSPTLKRCLFQENTSPTSAGGAMNTGSQCTVTATNCAFLGNRAAKWGGAVNHGATNSTATYINCLFSGNLADDAADVEEGYGGAIASRNSAVVTLINTTISGNSASHGGGGMMTSSGGNIDLTNSIVWNNLAAGVTTGLSASFLDLDTGTTAFSYCLVENATATDLGDPTNSLDGTDSANDPLFILAVDPSTAPTRDGDLRLSSASPAIDIGDNTANAESTDLDGSPRFINGDFSGATTIDLGAYEYATPTVQNPVDSLTLHLEVGATAAGVFDLSEVFADPLEGTLSFALVSNSDEGLVSVVVGADGVVDLTSAGTGSGSATLIFSASNAYSTGLHTVALTLGIPVILYVDSQAAAGGDGTTWATAYQHLQDALAVALANDQVWVAEGTYYPDEGTGQSNNNRNSTFYFRPRRWRRHLRRIPGRRQRRHLRRPRSFRLSHRPLRRPRAGRRIHRHGRQRFSCCSGRFLRHDLSSPRRVYRHRRQCQ